MQNDKNPIIAVGIGPGNPDLITVKGLKALQQAQIIFYPATKISSTEEQSFSKKILQAYSLTATLQPLLLPMTGLNRSSNYAGAFKTIKTARESGKRVVVVSEGDSLFYSTTGYIVEYAEKAAIPYEVIPGIPAFIAGASEMKKPLVSGTQSFMIIAAPESFGQLQHHIDKTDVLVVMKPSTLKGWDSFLPICGKKFFYAEKIGTADQFLCNSISDLKGRKIPYFAIFIFRD